MKRSPPPDSINTFSYRDGVTYGLLGLPLAFAALPLYVVLPHYYANNFGLSLATIGGLLMLVRLIDAGAEPLLGALSDYLYRRTVQAVLWITGASALLIGIGMVGLFFPPRHLSIDLGAWMVTGLFFTSLAHSQLVITHQAWGVRLGGHAVQRSRIVAWREGLGLVGVISASALSVAGGTTTMLTVFTLALLLGWLALWRAPRPPVTTTSLQLPVQTSRLARLWQPLTVAAFRRLLAVFLCNGIASAMPAALMLFFAQDQLLASPAQIALFLILYFVSGALSLPAWLRMVRRWGLERAWLSGMLLAIACFGWSAGLAQGQVIAFAIICVFSGMALGADLAAPGALLALLIARQGAQGMHDGAYLGWWNLATKLNLALAAGVSLPLLQWLGYVPGTQNADALQHLAWAYALIPCALKLIAAWLLYRLCITAHPPHHKE
jgi:GPH family glycoside/pentoside/hexuronide:cation symporter